MKYHVTIVKPAGYLHSECFREVAEGLLWALQSLGHTAALGENTIDAEAINIVLGGHLLTEEEARMLFPSSILYNLEQLGSASLPPWYLGLASRLRIWDYSRLNLEKWRHLPCLLPPLLVEVGFAPGLRRIAPAPEQDIDVLFYGSMNDRRSLILQRLQAAGLRVHHVFGVYGKERDGLIARAKVVLNVHFYEAAVFEVVRVSYLLANGKAVVCEQSPDLGDLAEAVAACPYEELVERCIGLVAVDRERRALEARGAATFARRGQVEILRKVLAGEAASFPRMLNLGSGKDWREDCLNIDINDYWKPDAVLDISQPLPPCFDLATERFGSIRIEPGCFDAILAKDVLEHIPNLTQAMAAALQLLRPGGLFHIEVPYDLSWGGWQDPTHVRAFNERSWLYYTDWFWYLGWRESRFHVDKFELILSAVGERLKGTCKGEDLIRSPRAVDSMRLTMSKRLLSEQELQLVTRYLQRPQRTTGSPAAAVQGVEPSRQPVGAAPPPSAVPETAGANELSRLRKSYLDMVQRCVIGTVYEDPNQDRWSPHTYNEQLREAGLDWPSQAHSMIGNRRMTNLRFLAEFILRNDVPGDFIETGVWRGGACIVMRAVLEAYGDTSRRVWVADSFEGLPVPKAGLAADDLDQHHTYQELSVSADQVRANFARYGLLDDQVRFLEGWFSATLPTAPIERLALLRLDGDMYESTMDALAALYDKVSPGGFIIVDDFGAIPGCRKAIHEFRETRGITDPLHDIDGVGAFWRKLANSPATQPAAAGQLSTARA